MALTEKKKTNHRTAARHCLRLQDYAKSLARTQQSLEATCTSLQQTELLSGIISEQDLRTLGTACSCLNSLRIRVESPCQHDRAYSRTPTGEVHANQGVVSPQLWFTPRFTFFDFTFPLPHSSVVLLYYNRHGNHRASLPRENPARIGPV